MDIGQIQQADGRDEAASTSGMSRLLDGQRSAFLHEGPPPLARRLLDLDRLKEAILRHRERFVEAVSADFGHRSRQETSYLDLLPVVKTIDYLRRNLPRWVRPERRRVAFHFRPASARIVYQPLGVVGILSPWNYPVVLALTPLATALAAGNRVMLKPSELAPRTAEVLVEMLGGLFPAETVAVVTGDAETAKAFSRLPFDHLHFTGSTRNGHAVMRAASDHLVSVTLELGGKSPAIVDRGSSLKRAAHSIAFGKLANAGQTCIAPDYALVPAEAVEAFVTCYRQEVDRFYPGIATNPDYTTIVSDRHVVRLQALLDDASAKGANIRICGENPDVSRRLHPRTFLPRIVTAPCETMTIMQEEIFGPILPVVAYESLDQAIAFVNARPRPLALYFFGARGRARNEVLARTVSGSVTLNDTLLHYAQDDLPFGGVGASGMGAYHGHEGFRALSHAKGVFDQPGLNAADVIRPPFGKRFDRLIAFLLR